MSHTRAAVLFGLSVLVLHFPFHILTTASPTPLSLNRDSNSVPQSRTEARNALDNGVQAFKEGRYDDAVRFFRLAKELDPSLLNARFYLATAYASQYIPGAPSQQNIEMGQKAVEEFKDALAIDPQNLTAIDGIGSILFQMAGTPYDAQKFQQSKDYHQKHILLKPQDPEPHYWIGVIDWTLTFRANSEMRANYNKASTQQIRDTDPLPSLVREEYRIAYGPLIDEGIEHLKRAIALKPDYDDAMAYLNLLYRRKADTVARESERAQLIKMADDLIDRVKEIKTRRAGFPN